MTRLQSKVKGLPSAQTVLSLWVNAQNVAKATCRVARDLVNAARPRAGMTSVASMSTVHADDDAGPGRSWTEMIRAGLRLVGVACCVANLLGGLGVALFLVDPTPASRLGLALVLAGQAAILLAVAGEHRSGWRTALVLALSFGGAALALPATTWTTGPAAWWPTQFVLTIVGYLVYVEPPGRRWYLVALVISANAWARVESWPRDAQRPDARLLPQLAFESTQAAVMAVTVYLTLSAVLAAAAQADAARTAARSRREAEQRERAREARSREVDRFIHDEVLHALRSIALERDAVPAEQAAEHGRRLARLMSGMPDVPLPSPDSDQSKARRDLTATLQDVAGRSGLQVTVIGPRPLSVPLGVGQAFARAVEESLRNVARHAGTDRARVRLRRSGFTVSVIVTDEGVGFDPHAVDAERRGVSASIAQRMSDVRGSAHVDSEPGRGTIVTLRWRPRVEGGHPGEDGLAAGAIDRLAPAGVAAYLPFLLANPWLAFWMAPLLILPLAGWAGSVLAVTAGLAATAVGLRRGLRGWHSAVLSLVAWAASLANGLALPPGSTNPSLYWLAGGVSGILYLQVLLRPLREAVVTGLGLTAIALACALHALDGLSQLPLYLPALLSPALALVSAVLLGRTVDAMGWEVLRAERRPSRQPRVSG